MVGGAHVVRAEHIPLRIVPRLGQVPENTSKPSSSEHWGVFHEHVARSHLANNPDHFAPEPASASVDSNPFPGGADVLAGEPTTDNLDAAGPGSSVKSSDVVPDGESGQDAVPLPLQQDGSAVGFNLDSTDTGMAEKHSAEDSSPAPSKKV